MRRGQQINILTKRAHADNTHLRPPPKIDRAH